MRMQEAKLVPKRKQVHEKRQVDDRAFKWLESLVKEKDLNVLETFALSLGWPAHHFRKMMHERKNWTMAEAAAVANALDISVLDLFRRFGIEILERKTKVVGSVRANGIVTPSPGPKKEIWPPADADQHTRALYVAVTVTGCGLLERSYLYFQDTGYVVDNAWGRLCFIKPIGDGTTPYIGTLSRASQAQYNRYEPRTVDVTTVHGKTIADMISSAEPITWQRID